MSRVAPRLLRREDVPQGDCLCDHCSAKCCRYYALPLDKPTDLQDFDFIRWFMIHGRTCVFTEDKTWYLLVYNECQHLQSDNRCGIYETRPQICRDYTTDECEFEDRYVYDRYFEAPDQVLEYVEAIGLDKKKRNIRSPEPALLPIL